jgi:predicted  nucleic acid-binding Zn-ribbon protein
MSPELAALVALQRLDTAADSARRRLAEIPTAERDAAQRITAATAAVEAVKVRIAENHHTRRALEKEVAGVDSRLARFDEHKAAVKTNQEYTALLHEISTAKAEKNAAEDKILVLLEAADELGAELKAAEARLAEATREVATIRESLAAERRTIDDELARRDVERRGESAAVAPGTLAK